MPRRFAARYDADDAAIAAFAAATISRRYAAGIESFEFTMPAICHDAALP